MRTILIALALAVGASAQQPDQNQPFDVNGVQLGSAFSDWQKGPGAKCTYFMDVEPDVASYRCPDLVYAGVQVQETVSFYHGRLINFYLVASHKDFASLRAAMKEKFGQPWRTEQKVYSLNGITLTGEHNRWSNGTTSLNLAEFSPDRDHTLLFFSNVEVMADKTKSAKAKAGGL
ncbi:MAG TPA: hypothetical protein VFT65_10255 [Candidatus Angelobacter sp.]|nr:hypothetical protein [Candidatus Angelobacter sp.]